MSRPVVLYDGGCRFCRFAARMIEWLDLRRRFAFLPLQDDEATPLLAGVPDAQRLSALRLAEPGGRLRTGTDAARAILECFNFPSPGIARAYPFVARRRGVLGRFVPDRPGPRRFP